MQLHRDEHGVWTSDMVKSSERPIQPDLAEALPRYLTALEPIFSAAKHTNELEFLFSMFRVRGAQDVGWDPYQTTLEAIPLLVDAEASIRDARAARHLHLWIYGHILEASEPYEIIANLLEVAGGRHYAWNTNFPHKKNGAPQSPGEKIRHIEQLAISVKLPNAVVPLQEVWSRELRNAVFHADYSFYGPELRLANPGRILSDRDVSRFVNRALAYHSALALLFEQYRMAYPDPVVIPNSPHFKGDPDLQWTVIVRDGFGAAGVKDSWTSAELRTGRIPVRVGRFFENEILMLNDDPTLSRLPLRPEHKILC